MAVYAQGCVIVHESGKSKARKLDVTSALHVRNVCPPWRHIEFFPVQHR